MTQPPPACYGDDALNEDVVIQPAGIAPHATSRAEDHNVTGAGWPVNEGGCRVGRQSGGCNGGIARQHKASAVPPLQPKSASASLFPPVLPLLAHIHPVAQPAGSPCPKSAPGEAKGQLLGHQAVADVKGGKHGERGDKARLCNHKADGI